MHIDEETIFHEALSRDDAQDRANYLDDACAGNANLKSHMHSLLLAYTSSEFLDSPPAEVKEFLTSGHGGNLDGSQIGPYCVLELLGEGGMGEVYLAERCDAGTRSQVALKVIKLGMDSRQVLARFHLEQETLKRLEHRHIARFLDAGVTDTGRLYFAMELVEGIPITQYCDREQLPVQQRLKLLIDTCQAVAHAHERGIVHRDLKPANVLVSLQAGNPVVKVIDFGVAKTLEECLIERGPHTRATQMVGTPDYMSPEQARWSSDVDLRTDVYSLGTLLYELLTGSTPLRRETANQIDPSELRHRIQTEEPPWPSHRIAQLDPEALKRVCTSRATQHRQLVRQLRGDLDWITLRALEIDRERRYASPAELAADLAAFLEQRTIAARGPSLVSRLSKWTKRYRSALQRTVVIALVACVAIGFFWLSRLSRDARNTQRESQAIQSRVENDRMHDQFIRDIREAAACISGGDSRSALKLLNKYVVDSNQTYAHHFAVNYLRTQIPKTIALFEGHQKNILDMDLSHDERWIASGDRGGDVIIWDRVAGLEVYRLHPSDKEVTRVRFSPDGRLLAMAGQDGLVWLWNVGDSTPISTLAKHELTINGLAWSPDGRKIACGDRGGNVFIWSVELQTCDAVLPQHAEPVRCLAWSPNGKYLATASGDVGVTIWATEDWSQTDFITNNDKGTLAIAFSLDSRFMAFGGYGAELVLVDLSTKIVVQRTEAENAIWSLAFGDRYELLAGESSGFLQVFRYSWVNKIWESVRVVDSLSEDSVHRRLIYSADQKLVYVASEQDRLIKTLSKSSITGYQSTELNSIPVGVITEQKYLLCANNSGRNGTVRRTDNYAVEFPLPIPVSRYCCPQYSSSNNLIAVASENEETCQVYLLRPGTWETVARFESPGRIRSLSFARNGKYLAASGDGGLARIWNLRSNEHRDLRQDLPGFESKVVFSPASDALVFGWVGTTKLTYLHAESLDEIRTITTIPNWHCVQYTPNGEYVIVGEEARISVWTSDLTEMLWASPGASSVISKTVVSICCSPDQRTVATLLFDGTVKLWDLQSRSELFSVPPPNPAGDYRWISFIDSATLLLGAESESKIFSLSAAALPFTRLNISAKLDDWAAPL